MQLTSQERTTLAGLSLFLLVGLAALLGRWPTASVDGAPTVHDTVQWDGALASARQVDVNTATVAELERLPGVGPALARRIVDDRIARGPFRGPEELSRVEGIGPKTVAALRDYIAVE